jgi:hypothetical protein
MSTIFSHSLVLKFTNSICSLSGFTVSAIDASAENRQHCCSNQIECAANIDQGSLAATPIHVMRDQYQLPMDLMQ